MQLYDIIIKLIDSEKCLKFNIFLFYKEVFFILHYAR